MSIIVQSRKLFPHLSLTPGRALTETNLYNFSLQLATKMNGAIIICLIFLNYEFLYSFPSRYFFFTPLTPSVSYFFPLLSRFLIYLSPCITWKRWTHSWKCLTWKQKQKNKIEKIRSGKKNTREEIVGEKSKQKTRGESEKKYINSRNYK